MSSTRLLVLGAVRIFQPVHGHVVRRELLAWRVERWASLNPGSVYHALRSLASEGLLADAGTEAPNRRHARIYYSLTPGGEAEFGRLLRESIEVPDAYQPDQLLAATVLMWELPRADVIELLHRRIAATKAWCTASKEEIAAVQADRSLPGHAGQGLRLVQARVEGELSWVRETVAELERGAHAFAGEPAAERLHELRLRRRPAVSRVAR